MDKTLFGLAVIQFYWEQQGKDIIDAYVPLACSCIAKRNPEKVSFTELRDYLIEDYGLNKITLGAVTTIIKRMSKRGFLHSYYGENIVQDELYKSHGENPEPPITEDVYEKLVNSISIFSSKTFNEKFDADDVYQGLMDFMDVYAEDLMLKPDKFTQNITHNSKKKLRYIISCFTCEAYKNDKTTFALLVKVATGRSLMSLVTFDNIESLTGHMRNVKVYIDAPIVYNLLDLNGDANFELVNELMTILHNQGAKFGIFRKHHNEVVTTMQDAIYRLQTKKYDYRLSSRLLKTALRTNMTSSNMQLKLSQLSSLFQKWSITVEDAPDLPKGCYDINMKRLSDLITDIYSNKGSRTLEEHEEELVDTDVDTLAYTYRLRGDYPITNLKDCRAILVTNNLAIAFATKVLNNEEIHHVIPGCVTDVFLSTMMWTMFPEKNQLLNEKLLMSECYSNMLLDDKLLMRYYDKLDELHHKNVITDDQLVMARSSNMAYKLLEDITYNDSEAFTDQTPLEILERIKTEINCEKDELAGRLEIVGNNVRRISVLAALIMVDVIWSLLFLLLLLSKIKLPTGWAWDTLWLIVSFGFAFWGLLSWMKIIPSKDYLTGKLSIIIEKAIKSVITKKD